MLARQSGWLAVLALLLCVRSEAWAATGSLEGALQAAAPTLKSAVLRAALQARASLLEQGKLDKPEILAVIDYSVASTRPRLWVFDVKRTRLLFHELVAHGKNSGENFTREFSNEVGSEMTSLGVFVTGATYQGRNGLSLKLQGLNKGFNDASEERAIVMHGADYVNERIGSQLGRLGRSQGCPAVRRAVALPLIEKLRDGAMLFSWYPDREWLAASRFLTAKSVLAD